MESLLHEAISKSHEVGSKQAASADLRVLHRALTFDHHSAAS
jgi:hypothetical protein